jgi:hypothetical protein
MSFPLYLSREDLWQSHEEPPLDHCWSNEFLSLPLLALVLLRAPAPLDAIRAARPPAHRTKPGP